MSTFFRLYGIGRFLACLFAMSVSSIAALQARIPALPFQGDAAPEPAADPVAAEGLWARVKGMFGRK